MRKQAWTWTTQHLPEAARLARWGHYGTPVLVFPTAGGDFEEIERFQLIAALEPLIAGGRLKVYSVDGTAVRAWLEANRSASEFGQLRNGYDLFVREEVLPRIREDCQNPGIEPILAGASLGAAIAVGTLCRHPDAFRSAMGLSGLYDVPLGCELNGQPFSVLDCIRSLEPRDLERLRLRAILLGSGEGDYESPWASQRLSEAFASRGVPCSLDLWGPDRDHTWATWRQMLPRMLADVH